MPDYRNTGRLFKNDKKEPGDKRPDYTGDFEDASGKKMRLAAWIKNSGKGNWMSLKVTEFQQDNQRRDEPDTQEPHPGAHGGGHDDTEIPFAPETR